MNPKRFYHAHSFVYGWCVYDRDLGHTPAYFMCGELLPHKVEDDGTHISVSPVLLANEEAAARLAFRLNAALRRYHAK